MENLFKLISEEYPKCYTEYYDNHHISDGPFPLNALTKRLKEYSALSGISLSDLQEDNYVSQIDLDMVTTSIRFRHNNIYYRRESVSFKSLEIPSINDKDQLIKIVNLCITHAI